MRFNGLAILLSIIVCQQSFAQLTNERCKWVKTLNKPVILDTLTVIPGSVSINSDEVTINLLTSSGKLILKSYEIIDSVYVCYKVYPLAFNKKFSHRSLAIYDSNAYFKDPVKKKASFLKQEELFKTEGLYKSGSISRGISFGNNQDVFVNSALNLNLDGQLAENLFIRAAITDQNVPYQPEGNTQQLQDFDNVFIELYNDNFSLTGGDIVFQNQPSNFLRYYKNVQGGRASLQYDIEGSKAESTVGFSVAKGRFASVQIQPTEGLAGPYRIPSPNNERFILILANSERVFLDGKQLKRGFDYDYIIDYNSGEVTFTSNILITQFSRIRVDYEFSDQNYSRAITIATHNHQLGDFKLSINAYSESDNENRPLLFDLTDEDKLLLSSVGDSLALATVESADSVEFSVESVLYRKVEVIDLDDQLTSIFQYSTNPDSAFYQVSFSEVGLGNGDYIQVNSTANGRVFEWVSPENGIKRGTHSPTTVLPAPNKRQMVAFNVAYELNEYENTFVEVAFSNRDENLFSDLDNDDNSGFAIKTGILTEGRSLGKGSDYKLTGGFDFEYDNATFTAIDRFRYIEFDRDWNYNPIEDTRAFADQIINANLGVKKDEHNLFNYRITYRDRGEQVNGFQHTVDGRYRIKKLQLAGNYFKMNNSQRDSDANWVRYSADVSIINDKFIPGYNYNVDHNVITNAQTDSVQFSAMYFDEHTAYIRSGKESSIDFDLRHTYREDKNPLNGEIEDFSTSQTTRLFLKKDFKTTSVNTVFNYRTIEYTTNTPLEETISGRLDWLGRWFDNHIRSEVTYAIANSQELRREFVFIQVPVGQGTHTWRDLNEDGVQDLSEFFEAINQDERNYAKIFTPTNEFISAFQNLLVFRVNIDAPRSWRNLGGMKGLLAKFSSNTSWSADTKTTDKDLSTRLLAFTKDINEDLLLTERNSLRSTLFFNRTHSVYGLDFTYTNSENKQLLTNGFESRNIEEFISGARINLTKQYSLNIRTKTRTKRVDSDFLADRNYLLDEYEINPQLSWQPNNKVRFALQYSLTDKQNILTSESTEKATLNELMAEIRLNKAVKSNLNATVRWIEIEFEGEEVSPIGYDMLEALRPGQNITWTLNWQKKVTNGLQLNLSYNGRKSEGNNAVHIGRVQVSALF